MKNKLLRMSATVFALAMGTGITLALTYVGRANEGPINDFLDAGGNIIHSVETKIIQEPKTVRRTDKLRWFSAQQQAVSSLKQPIYFLLGAYDNNALDSYESIVSLEDSLQSTFPLIQLYSAWGSHTDQDFPMQKMKAIEALGSTPVLTWEPWLSAFDENDFPQLRKTEDRDKGGLADIANGTYDFYITAWAKKAALFASPFFLRFAHEMNDPYRYPWGPQNNAPADYIAAWKHIQDIFSKEGARNVIWIYSPHAAYGNFADYYPGDSAVDYVGTAVLNYGNVASWSQWWSFDEIFGKHYAEFAAFKKPIMITEFASLATGGNRSEWYKEALNNLPNKYPLIKSLLFFHFSNDKTTTQQSLDWYVKNDPDVVAQIRKGIKSLN